VDVSSIVTLAVIHSKMNRCLSSSVNTVKTCYNDVIHIDVPVLLKYNTTFHWVIVPDFKKQNHMEFCMDISTLEDEIVMLSQNVGHQTPNDKAPYLRRTET